MDGNGGWSNWVWMRNVREAVGVVEAEKDVGKGKFEGICAEVLARPAGYNPFLSRAILGPIKHYVSVDKVIV